MVSAEFRDLFNNEKWADVILVCDPGHSAIKAVTYHAHKSTICTRSTKFARSLSNSPNGEVKLTLNADPVIAKALLQHLYGCDYKDIKPGRPLDERSVVDAALVFDVHVYHIAQEYGAEGLKASARDSLANTLHNSWNHNRFFDFIDLYYKKSDKDHEFSKVFEKVCLDHVHKLVQKKGFNEMLAENSNLAIALVNALATPPSYKRSASQKN